MKEKETEDMTPEELQALEKESERAWLDKRHEKAQEAMLTLRESLRDFCKGDK